MAQAQKQRAPAAVPDARDEFSRFHQSDISLMADERIPGYRLHTKIGQGGMGSIYLATDPEGKTVALKLMPRFKEGHGLHHLTEWFTRECAATLAIAHPNVIGSYCAGRTENYLYLSLEVLDGGTLNDNLKSWGRLTWEQAKPVMLDVSRGVHAVHETGIIHRDLKPENFMLMATAEGVRTKLIDFGLCYISGYEDIYAYMFDHVVPYAPTLSSPSGGFGTPMYRAPEYGVSELRQKRTYDIYSAGLMLYELVCGQLPFDVIPDLAQEFAILYCDHMHKNVKFPSPSERVPGLSIPKGAEELIMRALEKDPKNRFQTMEEMGRAIEAVA